MKSPFGSALVILSLLFLWGCGSKSDPSAGPTFASIDVTPASASLTNPIGPFTTTYQAFARDKNFNTVAGVTFSWKSSDKTIACADQSGVAYAIKDGTVNIIASASGISNSAQLIINLNLTGNSPPPIPTPQGCQ